jgi:hypothetical protein
MLDPFKRYRAIVAGLHASLEESQSYSSQIPKKLKLMQEVYLQRNPDFYSAEQIRTLRYYQSAFAFKDAGVALSLEQLWSLVHAGEGDRPLLQVLANIFDDHRIDDPHLALLSFTLENFLLQATAFLDFYMLHLCAFFHIDDTYHLSGQKLMKALREVDSPLFEEKAEQVEEFFQSRVFGKGSRGAISIGGWGDVLRELRHSIVHRDIEYPSFDTGEQLTVKKTAEWAQSLRSIEAVRFAQDVQNDMFFMVTELSAVLYDLEWKPGPFRPDLWKV